MRMKWEQVDLEKLVVAWQTSDTSNEVMDRMRAGDKWRVELGLWHHDLLHSQALGQVSKLRRGGVRLKPYREPYYNEIRTMGKRL